MVTFKNDDVANKRVLLISLSEQQIATAMLGDGHIRKDMYTQVYIPGENTVTRVSKRKQRNYWEQKDRSLTN